MNAANLISLLRIVLVPVFLIFLVSQPPRPGIALIIFLAAAFSDALDGIIARKTKSISSLGIFLDPMADKLLLLSAFVSLAYMGLVPAWVAIIIVFRDLLLFIGWIGMNIVKNINIIAPSILSKITTFLQMITVVAVIWQITGIANIPSGLLYNSFILTALFTALSGIHYMMRAFRLAVLKTDPV